MRFGRLKSKLWEVSDSPIGRDFLKETMQNCLITTMTMTLAMKGKRLLASKGIAAEVTRLPPNLTASGCAWGISIDCAKAKRAREILSEAKFTYGKIAYADGTLFSLENESTMPSAIVTGTPRTTFPRGKGGSV